ncbi:MAG TPA: UMP kinase [Bacilli bacterium]|nr:UMP kinase [Bacilli bacterium]
MVYKRVLLKFSGEALANNNKEKIYDPFVFERLINFIKSFHAYNKMEVAVVVGAGNIWRGRNNVGIKFDAAESDYIGMLGTVMNAIALKDQLIQAGVDAVILSAFLIEGIAEKTTPELANKYLEAGKIVLFAGGTGKPFFTTDTGAAMRAIDINADAIIMAKDGVDGLYTKNPHVYRDAQKIASASYQDLIDIKIEALDLSALELLKETNIHLLVLGMDEVKSFETVEEHIEIGTIVKRGVTL